MARTASKVLSKLLVSTIGFNFHENIIETIVPLLNDSDDQISSEVKEGIIALFRNDRLGNKTLKIVQNIAALVRNKGPGRGFIWVRSSSYIELKCIILAFFKHIVLDKTRTLEVIRVLNVQSSSKSNVARV